MLAWQIPYLGWRKLPVDLSDFEIAHFFTLRPEERRAVRSKYKLVLRLGVALQIGFLRMCGRPLDAVQRVPTPLLRHLSEQLDVPSPDLATLRGLYQRRRRTLFEHQAWAIEFLGLRRFEATDTGAFMRPLMALVRAGAVGDQLFAATRRALHEQRFVIPGPQRVASLARSAVAATEQDAYAAIEREVPVSVRSHWLEELVRPYADRATLLEYLVEPPGKFSPTAIQRQADKVQALLDLGAARYPVAVLTPAQLRAYARRVFRRRPSRFRAMAEPRRTLELVSFFQHSLLDHTDTLIKLIDRRVAQLWRRAREDASRLPGGPSSSQVFVDRVRAVVAAAGGSRDDRLAAIEALLVELDAGALRPPCLAVRQRELLSARGSQIRPLLRMLLSLDLRSDDPQAPAFDVDAWRRAYSGGSTVLAPALCPPRSRAWQVLVADPDARRAFSAAEAMLLWHIRQALRRGSTYVPHSFSYRSRQLLFAREDSAVRAAASRRPAGEFLDQLSGHLEAAFEHLADAVTFERVRVDGDKLHIHALAPHEAPADIDEARAVVSGGLPTAHLPELMLEVDAAVRFSWILLGREPASEFELLYLYTALLGQAMDVGPQRLAMMVPGLTVDGIADALQILEDASALRNANEAVVDFLRSHAIALHWGRGVDCASDAMSLDVSRHIWTARTDPRRRTWSTAVYSHVLDQWGIAYDQPLPLMTRQPGAAIEGALRQNITAIKRVMTDTHGYTAWAMGLAKLLGFDLCPRLKSFRDRRLHVPRGFAVPDELKAACLTDISLSTIEAGWGDLCGVADAVASGRLSAVLACERFGSASRGEKAYKAGHSLGLLLRTVHLCDTLSITDFRRETLRLLNHGELVHALQRQIRRAGFGSRRGRRQEELVAQSGSLTLVTNLVMASNTAKMQDALDRWRSETGRRIPGHALRHVSPAGFEHINFDGVLMFPVDRFRKRILPSASEIDFHAA